jgi:hypothetical protein
MYVKMRHQDKEFGNALLYIKQRPDDTEVNFLGPRDIFIAPEYRQDKDTAIKMNSIVYETKKIITNDGR